MTLRDKLIREAFDVNIPSTDNGELAFDCGIDETKVMMQMIGALTNKGEKPFESTALHASLAGAWASGYAAALIDLMRNGKHIVDALQRIIDKSNGTKP